MPRINDYHNDFTIFGGTVVRLVEFLTGAGKVSTLQLRVGLSWGIVSIVDVSQMLAMLECFWPCTEIIARQTNCLTSL